MTPSIVNRSYVYEEVCTLRHNLQTYLYSRTQTIERVKHYITLDFNVNWRICSINKGNCIIGVQFALFEDCKTGNDIDHLSIKPLPVQRLFKNESISLFFNKN